MTKPFMLRARLSEEDHVLLDTLSKNDKVTMSEEIRRALVSRVSCIDGFSPKQLMQLRNLFSEILTRLMT